MSLKSDIDRIRAVRASVRKSRDRADDALRTVEDPRMTKALAVAIEQMERAEAPLTEILGGGQ